VNAFLITLILTHTKPTQPGRVYIWFLASMSLWILGEAIIDLPGASKETVIFCARAMHVAGGAGLVAWLWFCHDITGRLPKQRKLLWILSLLIIPWCFLAWTPLLIADSTRPPWGDYLVTGYLAPVYSLWVFVCGGTGLLILLQAARQARGHLRAQLNYIILGMVFLLSADILTCLLLPILFSSMVYSRFGPLSTVVTTITVTYAIIRYRLMDIRIVLRAGLTYLLTGCTTLLLALAFLQSTVTLFHLNTNFRLDVVLVVIILAMILVIHPVWRGAAYLTAKYFLKLPYSYEGTLERVSTMLATAYERQTVIDTIADTLQHTLRPISIYLFTRNHSGSFPWCAYRFGELKESHTEGLLASVAAIDWTPKAGILFTEELLRGPHGQSNLGSMLAEYDITLICPMIALGKTNGILCLTEKSSGDLYTDGDVSLVRSIANYAALAWENTLAYEAVQAMNQQLERRVEERTAELVRANEQLHQANTTLKEADKAKDNFLAYLSHELMTPLTSIIGWAELAEDDANPEIMVKSLGVIHRNALRQKKLVSELLFVSRLIHHSIQLHPDVLDFRELCLHTFESFECLAQEKRIGFNYVLPEHPIALEGDVTRLQQAMDNLLRNALKFTESGGLISAVVRDAGGSVHVTIRDTGQGIDPAFLASVFKPFTQAQRDERHGGLGIGLALVKGIVELHGGTVSVESAGLGQGSVFQLMLPTQSPDMHDVTGKSDYVVQ
jgi:signal transduction histidine kinase/uncharacterized membrane protein